jgi:hypothetical protein
MNSRRDFLHQAMASLGLSVMPTGAMAGQEVRHYQLKAELA